jgi:tight adherence protein B
MVTVFIVLGFLAGFLIIFGVNFFIADVQRTQRSHLRERLLEEQRLLRQERARAAIRQRGLKEISASADGQPQWQPPLRERIAIFFEQTGTRLGPEHIAMACAAIALSLGAVMYLLARSVTLAAVVAVVAGSIPVIWVCVVRSRRLEKLLSQLPDAFDLMSRTMRAGQTLSQAMLSIVDEGSPPLSEEFGYCYEQQNLGMSAESAMRDLVRRTGLLEMKIFVLAVLIHRQTGGNLSDLLEKLAGVIRERYRIRGVIKTLTAEGRLQALILLGLPFVLMLVIRVLNRQYLGVLFEFPLLLGAMVVFMLVGALWIRKIVKYDF